MCIYFCCLAVVGEQGIALRFAFIEFVDLAAAQTALGMTGTMLAGRPLK